MDTIYELIACLIVIIFGLARLGYVWNRDRVDGLLTFIVIVFAFSDMTTFLLKGYTFYYYIFG